MDWLVIGPEREYHLEHQSCAGLGGLRSWDTGGVQRVVRHTGSHPGGSSRTV